MGMSDFLQGIRNQYSGARDNFMSQLLGVGGHGAQPGDPGGTQIHVNANESVLNHLPVETWPMAIPALQAAGIGNELVGGALEWGQGKPFFSQNGFDVNDLSANQVGIGNALGTASGAGELVNGLTQEGWRPPGWSQTPSPGGDSTTPTNMWGSGPSWEAQGPSSHWNTGGGSSVDTSETYSNHIPGYDRFGNPLNDPSDNPDTYTRTLPTYTGKTTYVPAK
jgi:hypothetical protein